MGDIQDRAEQQMRQRVQIAGLERDWSMELRRVSLVAEADIDHDLAIRALRGVRQLQRRDEILLRDRPACVVVGMVAIAADDYEAGSYWSAFFDHLGERQDQYTRAKYGDAFIAALDHFGLPYDVGGGLTYLGPLTLHAAVPTYCLADLLALLAQRDRLTVGLDGEGFVAWATGIGAPTRLNRVDVPVRRFLHSGGEFAVDMVDRLLEMLHALKSGETDLEWTGLPQRVIAQARRLYDSGELDLSSRQAGRSRRGQQRDARPTLGLDVAAGTVVVRLPPVGEAPDGRAVWSVALDGDVERVASNVLWPGSHEPVPAAEAIVRRPVRSASVSLDGSHLETSIDIVDADDPLLVFGDDGYAVSSSAALPRGRVWVLHLDDLVLETDGDINSVAEVGSPLGWAGWTLRLISLDNLNWIRGNGRRRWIRRTRQARFELPEPLVGVTTRYGSPVYAEPPVVNLPASGDSTQTWTVTVRESGTGRMLHTETVEVGTADEVVADPFEHLQRPLLGSFDVTIRGRLGSGQERSFVIAEGLRPRLSRAFRPFTYAGLAPTTVQMVSDAGLNVSSGEHSFAEDELTHMFDVNTNEGHETLYMTPPHMKVARVSASGGGRWSPRPLRETVESLSDPGRMVVSIPAQVAPTLQVMAAGDDVQGLVPSGRRVEDQVSYELSRIADTIREYGRAELVIGLDNMTVPIAQFRPIRMATGCTLQSGLLLFDDFAGIDDIYAGLYQCLAPWRRPEAVPIEPSGYVFIPDEYVGTGPMMVDVRLDDPWSPQPWPAWPSGASTYFVEQPGLPGSNDPGEFAVIKYLDGRDETPDVPTSFSFLWHVLRRRRVLSRAGVRRDLRADIERAFRLHPEWALASLLDSGFNAEEAVKLAVETGLPCLAPAMEPNTLRQLWRLYPAAACLAMVRSCDLPLDEIQTACGTVALKIASGEGDPYTKSGVFDATARRMASMTSDQVDAFWSAAQIVPKGMLEADTRATASRALFDARGHPKLRGVLEASKLLLEQGEQNLRRAGVCDETLDWLAARRGPDGSPPWGNLPAVSSTFAALARRAARGDSGAHEFVARAQRYWAALAKCAPKLVAIDVVVAEFIERGQTDPISQVKEPDGDQEY